MKALKWILLAALVVVVASGATGVYAYNMGRQEGMRAGLAMRTEFIQSRAAGGTSAAGGTTNAAGGTTNAAGAGPVGGVGVSQGAVVTGRGQAGNLTAGQVKSVSGNELEITTSSGVVKVRLTDKTQIEKMVAGAPADIKPGERVVAQGTRDANGVLEATTVQLGAGRFVGPMGPASQGQSGQ